MTGFRTLLAKELRRFQRVSVQTVLAPVVTALLYYFGPNRRQTFRRLWAGAALATLMWLATTTAFAWYVRNIANYNVVYGSLGASIALLVWMYLMAVISLVGCEFNAIEERTSAMG